MHFLKTAKINLINTKKLNNYKQPFTLQKTSTHRNSTQKSPRKNQPKHIAKKLTQNVKNRKIQFLSPSVENARNSNQTMANCFWSSHAPWSDRRQIFRLPIPVSRTFRGTSAPETTRLPIVGFFDSSIFEKNGRLALNNWRWCKTENLSNRLWFK